MKRHFAFFAIAAVLLAGCATTHDQIDRFARSLFVTGGLWENGAWPIIDLPQSASAEQVVAKYFKSPGLWINYEIEKRRTVLVRDHFYTAVLLRTNRGEMIAFLRYDRRENGWWFRVYDAGVIKEEGKSVSPDYDLLNHFTTLNRSQDGVVLTAKLPKRCRFGSPIPMEVQLVNSSTNDVVWGESVYGAELNVLVQDTNGTPIPTTPKGKELTEPLRRYRLVFRTLKPGSINQWQMDLSEFFEFQPGEYAVSLRPEFGHDPLSRLKFEVEDMKLVIIR